MCFMCQNATIQGISGTGSLRIGAAYLVSTCMPELCSSQCSEHNYIKTGMHFASFLTSSKNLVKSDSFFLRVVTDSIVS